MAALRASVAVGLDIGQAATKLVMVKGSGDSCTVLKSAILNHRDEGIVSEQEVGEHLAEWLREQGVRSQEITVGIQQYFAIAQLSDFPPAKTQQLEDMVELETQQVAGLSDETFVHGYRQLKPTEAMQNPVLIGVCRESAVWMRLEPLLESANVVDVAMDGYALALAYERLVPKDDKEGVHLLLDVGVENTTMTVMDNGEPVYVGSFTAGGQTFTSALMRSLSLSEAEAERTKQASSVNAANFDSPITLAARTFVGELHTALENWQYQGNEDEEEGEVELPRISRIYLSGGGSRLPGFGDYLGGLFDCPVQRLEPAHDVDHGFAIAYGLAVHAASVPARRISLAPRQVHWTAQRRRRMPSLVAALVLTGLMLAGWLGWSYTTLKAESQRLASEAQRLERASRLASELKVLSTSVDKTERLLLPFAARGNRNATFVEAVSLLSKYQQRQDWFFFLADDASYREVMVDGSASHTTPSRALGGAPFGFASTGGTVETENAALTSEFEPWRELIAAGFTPVRSENQWNSVRQTVDALNQQPDTIFRGVDTLTQQYRSRRDIRLMAEWRELIDMKGFALRLPLRDQAFGRAGGP